MKTVEVKFCGMRSIDDARYALSLGVRYIGFVVDVPLSPRSISKNDFFSFARKLKKTRSGGKIVAVTVDKPQEELKEFAKTGFVDVLQLHGNESPALCAELKKEIIVWKAMSVRKSNVRQKAIKFRESVDRILLDTGSAQEKSRGTSGVFDAFSVCEQLEAQGIPLVLSGGLDARNIAEYLGRLRPEIIDVSRGIESSPGEKSKEKMKKFMEKINEVTKKHGI